MDKKPDKPKRDRRFRKGDSARRKSTAAIALTERDSPSWLRLPSRREFIYGAGGLAAGLALHGAYDYFNGTTIINSGTTSPSPPAIDPTSMQTSEPAIRLAQLPSGDWIEPEVRKSDPVKRVLRTQLVLGYTDVEINGIPVRLRCYEGKLTGPTLKARAGDTLYIELVNKLPNMTDQLPLCHEPHVTNLHTHGLHVDPTDGDDVLNNRVGPGETKTLRYIIPKDHYPGTFWYHPHKHGAVALQVANGLAGALIIEGDIDEIPEIAAARERIFLFQQIPYNNKDPKTVECDDIRADFERNTTINGTLKPRIRLRPGEVERWRFIHAGIKEKLKLKLDGHQLYVVAHDGITTGHLAPVDTLELNPGYRTDVLVKAKKLQDPSKPETYNIRDLLSEGLLKDSEPPQYLAEVVVEGDEMDMRFPDESILANHLPLKDLREEAINQIVRMEFNTKGANEFQICWPKDNSNCDKSNCAPFDKRTIPVKLNTVDEWIISTCNAFPRPPHHPFHIHVNPFQILSLNGAAPDPKKGEKVWGDTLLVEKGSATPPLPAILRTRYAKWAGETVLHCHILDHEDLGMMIKIDIQS